jgi:hypothetical protein
MPQSSRTARKAEPKAGRIQGAPLFCLGLLVSIAACEALAPSAPLPENAQLMSAPPQFMEWWQKTEECSGLRGDPSQIEWYVVPNVSVFSTGDGEKVGLWTRSSEGTRIILAGNYIRTSWLCGTRCCTLCWTMKDIPASISSSAADSPGIPGTAAPNLPLPLRAG